MAKSSFSRRFPHARLFVLLAILVAIPLTIWSVQKVPTQTKQDAAGAGVTNKVCGNNFCGRTSCDGPRNCTYHSWNCDGNKCNPYTQPGHPDIEAGHPWSPSCITASNDCIPPEPKLTDTGQYYGNVSCDPTAPIITVANLSWQAVPGVKEYNVYYLFNIKPYKIHKIPTTDTKMTLRLNIPYNTTVSWYVFSVAATGETSYWPSYHSGLFTTLCK